MNKITSVKNISENDWIEYFNLYQELDCRYYPNRYDESNTLERFKQSINHSYKDVKGYENYIIKENDLPIGWFYTTTWGDVLYIGFYINSTLINKYVFRSIMTYASVLMNEQNFNYLFTSSYRKTNIDLLKSIDAEVVEEFISSQIMRSEIDIKIFNSIIDDFKMDDVKFIYCDKVDDCIIDSYLKCYNLSFVDLMNLNRIKLNYEPITKEQIQGSGDNDSVKRIVILINRSNDVIGLSELYYNKRRKEYSCNSGFTSVHPDYRGKGIAKYLKAKLYTGLMKEEFEFDRITTNTLAHNRYINIINESLGFKVYDRGFTFRLSTLFFKKYLNNIE